MKIYKKLIAARAEELKRNHIKNLISLGFNGETKKLYAWERVAKQWAINWANGVINEAEFDAAIGEVLKKVEAMFSQKFEIVADSDGRGYCLKIPSDYVRANNIVIATDEGRDGILAMEF